METNEFDRSVQDWTPAQPHFDDERTLLSARPVVPLEKINKVRHRRHWLLGGAFVIAMILGAGSALLASYLRLRSVAATAEEVSQEETVAAPLAVAESVPSESPAVVERVDEEPADSAVEPAVEPAKASTVRHRAIARSAPNVDVPHSEDKVNEADDLNRVRDAVLYDEWQERRARRVRRERRKLDRFNHRDLSNLDEIFEGRRKP